MFILLGWEPQDFRLQQLSNPNIGIVLVELELTIKRPKWESVSSGTSALKTIWSQWDRLEIIGGILFRKFESNDGQRTIKQMIVPQSKKQDILHYVHDIPSAGHLGVDKTLEKLKTEFYWPNMKDYVQKYCRSCDRCFAQKPKKETNRAPLGTYIRRTYGQGSCRYYWTTSTFKTRHSYILVISDHFTKWTEAIAIPNQESTTICKAFVDNFITKYGTPLQLHSDQGGNFQSDTLKGMCSVLGIDKTRTTSFRPQSNGGVERFDRKLASMLAMYCQKNQETWENYMQQVMMAYRSSVHAPGHQIQCNLYQYKL